MTTQTCDICTPAGLTIQCATCGVEHDVCAVQAVCPICADERQYLPADGKQHWIEAGNTPAARLTFEEVEPGVHLITQHDVPGIGQKPLIVRTPAGNVMIEVPAHIDAESIAHVREMGGLHAIIASHPHMYGLQSQWSAAFDDCPVYISAKDQEWVGLWPANAVVWDGEVEIAPGMVASQPGGHFAGAAVVHWMAPDGHGVLFTGDTIAPVSADGWVTFMRSFPNYIPLSGPVVRRVAAHVARYSYERLYGNFGGRVLAGADAVVQRSAQRYAAWAEGQFDHLT